jgi:hypothetical protein
MGGKKGGQTIGFNYILTLLWGDSRGPVNEYIAIEADDKIAWRGHVGDSTPTPINKRNLFGGEQKEGGLQGAFRLFMGARDQVLPDAVTVVVDPFVGIFDAGPCATVTIPNIKTSIGGRVSELRGFVSGVYRGLVASMNPYPKEWHFCRWRTDAGWFGGTAWYPAKATICMPGDGFALEDGSDPATTFGDIKHTLTPELAPGETVDNTIRAMNPAHMVYQALTDPEWGAGRAIDELDENSFILAANTLCDERFGLCIDWKRQEDVDVFIQSVLDHVAGALYTDRTTGKLVFKLIRDDYVVADLPLYDYNSGLLSIEEDDSASSDEMINEIIVKGKDQSIVGRGMDFEVRVHNNAARQAQGAISDTLELTGLPTRSIALRRGQMELRLHAPGLKRFKLKFDRRAWQITPAGVVRISAPSNGISNMVVRFGDDIDYGDTTNSTITASAIEDVFGLPSASFQAIGGSTWTPPEQTAAPAAATRLIEGGYRDLVKRVGTSQTDALDPTSAYIGQLAQSPGYAHLYDLLSRVSGEAEFVHRASGSFTQRLLLSGSVTALATTLPVVDIGDLTAANVGEALLLDNEIVRIDDVATGVLTVARGCADTIPAPHADATDIWTVDDDLVPDGREYVSGETVETKVLTRTTSSLLSAADAATDSADMVARHYKPYPPGNVKIDAASVFTLSGVHPEPVLTWTDRDRLSENDQLIEHGAGSVGPEAGTTYTVRVKSFDGATLLRTDAAATSGWTYDAAMQTADGSPGVVLIELESVRDGVASWQMYSFLVTLVGGYGYGYGLNYGGA